MSLPSLLSTRPIDVSNPLYDTTFPSTWFSFRDFFPETIPAPCDDFPQFDSMKCGRFLDNGTYPGEYNYTSPLEIYNDFIWLVAMIFTASGVVFSVRALILLQFSTATIFLPYSRYFLIFAILISTLTALESCIIYQKFYKIDDSVRALRQILSEFDSQNLTHPLFQFIMVLLVSSRHTCLVILIFCYIDMLIFYRCGTQKPYISSFQDQKVPSFAVFCHPGNGFRCYTLYLSPFPAIYCYSW